MFSKGENGGRGKSFPHLALDGSGGLQGSPVPNPPPSGEEKPGAPAKTRPVSDGGLRRQTPSVSAMKLRRWMGESSARLQRRARAAAKARSVVTSGT